MDPNKQSRLFLSQGVQNFCIERIPQYSKHPTGDSVGTKISKKKKKVERLSPSDKRGFTLNLSVIFTGECSEIHVVVISISHQELWRKDSWMYKQQFVSEQGDLNAA